MHPKIINMIYCDLMNEHIDHNQLTSPYQNTSGTSYSLPTF